MKSPSDAAASVKHAGTLAVAGQCAAALGRNIACNLARWCRVLTRAPRAQPPPLPAGTVPAILVTLAVAAAAMFLVDARATDWASHRPAWFTGGFEQITDFGKSGWFLVPAGCIVLCLAALTSAALPRPAQGVLAALAARFGFVFLAIGAPGLFVSIVKRLIGRARPFVGGHLDPFAYMMFVWRPAYASMPSGHATNVTAAAVAIGAVWPRMRAVMWIYALVIMFSRIAVFAHFTSDVIVGALVGTTGAALVRRFFAARRLVFSPHDLAAYPGPSRARLRAALRRAVFRLRNPAKLECVPD